MDFEKNIGRADDFPTATQAGFERSTWTIWKNAADMRFAAAMSAFGFASSDAAMG